MTSEQEGASSAPVENLAATEAPAAEVAKGDESVAATPAANGDTPKTLLEAVENAIKPEPEKAPPAEAKTEDKPTEAAEPEKSAEEAEAADKLLPFHNHPRFIQINRQKNEAIKKAEELEKRFSTELEPLKTESNHYRSIVTYMRENGLTSDEVNIGFDIMAALKNDPKKAQELLRPYVETLDQFSGGKLHPELQAKVDSGEVEEAVARDYQRSRNEAAFERQKREQLEQTMHQDHQRIASQQASEQIMGAVAQWEMQVKASDPDYAKKQELVTAYIRAEQAVKPARSPQEAVEMARRAYDKANSTVGGFRPAPTPNRPVSSQQSVAGAKPEPKTLQEAIGLALAKGP